MVLKVLPFSEKSSFAREAREIISKKPNMPKIMCPVVGNISEEKFSQVDPKYILHSEVVKNQRGEVQHVRVATMDDDIELFDEEELETDANDDGEEHCQAVEEAMTEDANIDTILMGPLPLSWAIPDPEYTPTRPSSILFPGFIFHSYFKQWGNNDCEMIFQSERKITLLVKFARRDIMAQAALALYGARYICHNNEICPINLDFGNFDERKKKFLASQNSFAELTRGLSTVQKKAFTEIMRNMDRLERENEGLAREVKVMQDKKVVREKKEAERKQAEIDGVPLNEIDSAAEPQRPSGGPAKEARTSSMVSDGAKVPTDLLPGDAVMGSPALQSPPKPGAPIGSPSLLSAKPRSSSLVNPLLNPISHSVGHPAMQSPRLTASGPGAVAKKGSPPTYAGGKGAGPNGNFNGAAQPVGGAAGGLGNGLNTDLLGLGSGSWDENDASGNPLKRQKPDGVFGAGDMEL